MSEHRSILKSASVISGFTMLSRVTGFVRDVILAGIFGTGLEAQAFFVAYKIPNMMRDLMGEGAGNAAFVPVFCEVLQTRPRREFLDLVHKVFFLVAGLCIVVVAAGVLFSSSIIRVVAPGFLDDPAKFHLSVTLNRILFPYLLLVAVSAFLMSVANAMKSFAAPASTSVVFNLVLIAGLGCLGFVDQGRIHFLAVVVLLGGIAQILVQLPSLGRQGVKIVARLPRGILSDPAVRLIGRLMAPRVLGTSVYQLNVFIDMVVASLSAVVGDGVVAAIYYANNLIRLPLALFGVALSNAALPSLSVYAAQKDFEAFRAVMAFCLRVVFLGVAPVFVAFLVLPRPLVTAVFERGSFDAASTDITATAVVFYGVGLFAYAAVRLFSHASFALQDTRTPVKAAAAGLGVNVVLIGVFVFWWHWKVAGLAFSSALGAMVNAAWLTLAMRRRIGFSLGAAVAKTGTPIAVAAGIMGFVVYGFWYATPPLGGPLVKMVFTIFLGAAVYTAGLRALRVAEVEDLLRWVFKKR